MTSIQIEISQDNYAQWSQIFDKFKKHADQNQKLSWENFSNILGINQNLAASIMQKLSTQPGNQEELYLSFDEYTKLVKIFMEEDGMDFLFSCLSNDTETIKKENLINLINFSLKQNQTSFTPEQVVDILLKIGK